MSNCLIPRSRAKSTRARVHVAGPIQSRGIIIMTASPNPRMPRSKAWPRRETLSPFISSGHEHCHAAYSNCDPSLFYLPLSKQDSAPLFPPSAPMRKNRFLPRRGQSAFTASFPPFRRRWHRRWWRRNWEGNAPPPAPPPAFASCMHGREKGIFR